MVTWTPSTWKQEKSVFNISHQTRNAFGTLQNLYVVNEPPGISRP